MQASETAFVKRRIALRASSLPGMTNLMPSGSQLVSTTATIGMPRRFASLAAMCSFFGSMMNTTPGSAVISWMPPREFFSFAVWRSRLMRSFFDSPSKRPLSRSFSRLLRRSMEPLTVLKLVSMPPSHRCVTWNWPAATAASATMSAAWRFVPTKRTFWPRATAWLTNCVAAISWIAVFCRLMMWMPFFSPKM